MSIRELVEILRRHLGALIVLPILGIMCAAALVLTATPQYRATTSVYFSLPYGNSAVDLSQGSAYTQAQIESYAALATSPRVLQGVAKSLPFKTSVENLASAVQATSESGTVILQISATLPSAAHAALTADQTAASLRTVARGLSPKNSKGLPTVDATTIGSAKVPTSPATPSKKRSAGLGLIGGLAAAVAWAMLREKLNTRVRSVEELAIGDLPLLGSVSLGSGRAGVPMALLDATTSLAAEQFRRLRTSLLFTQGGEGSPLSLMVTSPGAAEGKSTVAVNLACAFAEAGQRVLLLDADMRRPSIDEKLDLEGAVGLSTILAGQAPFEEVVQPLGGTAVDVLAAGATPPNPAQLLGSAKMRDLMTAVSSTYEVVIVDCPPLLKVADAALISSLTSGSIFVVRQGRTRVAEVHEALAGLTNAEARPLGVVLSRKPTRLWRRPSHGYEVSSRTGRSRRHQPRRSQGGLRRPVADMEEF